MPINQQWVNQLRSWLDNPNNAMRGNFYTSVAREYSQLGSSLGQSSAYMVMLQAQIST